MVQQLALITATYTTVQCFDLVRLRTTKLKIMCTCKQKIVSLTYAHCAVICTSEIGEAFKKKRLRNLHLQGCLYK